MTSFGSEVTPFYKSVRLIVPVIIYIISAAQLVPGKVFELLQPGFHVFYFVESFKDMLPIDVAMDNGVKVSFSHDQN